MPTLKQQTASLRAFLAPVFGEINVKGYFSYIGFYKDGLLIALGRGSRFALRVTPTTKVEIQAAGGIPMEPENVPNTTQYFYWLPEGVIRMLKNKPHWFFGAMRYAAELKSRFKFRKVVNIRYLPNMNAKIERMLKKLGITTMEAFMANSAIDMFAAFIQKGIDVTDILYLKLYGALQRIYIGQYGNQTYEYLRQEGNQYLAAEGLRYRLRGFIV